MSVVLLHTYTSCVLSHVLFHVEGVLIKFADDKELGRAANTPTRSKHAGEVVNKLQFIKEKI